MNSIHPILGISKFRPGYKKYYHLIVNSLRQTGKPVVLCVLDDSAVMARGRAAATLAKAPSSSSVLQLAHEEPGIAVRIAFKSKIRFACVYMSECEFTQPGTLRETQFPCGSSLNSSS